MSIIREIELSASFCQTKKLKKLLSFGADIIVAHHPHTVQGYEKINNKMIFYSLGNFIFDTDFQRAQKGTDKGIVLKIEFTKDEFSNTKKVKDLLEYLTRGEELIRPYYKKVNS